MSQQERIIKMLQESEWVCITRMIADYIPDYRRRLCDIRAAGYELENRTCRQHEHQSRNLKEWRLISWVPKEFELINLPKIKGNVENSRIIKPTRSFSDLQEKFINYKSIKPEMLMDRMV